MEKTKRKNGLMSFLDHAIENIENYIISFGLLSISAIVFSTVIARYFFSTSFAWAEELSRYIIVWVTFIGMSSCAHHDAHVKVDLLANILKSKAKLVHNIIVNSIMVLMSAYMAYISYGFTLTQYRGGNTSVAIAIPVWIIYLSTVIGFVFCTFIYIRKLFIIIANKNEDSASDEVKQKAQEV